MTTTEARHEEKWSLTITPGDEDDWPLVPVPYSSVEAMFRAEKVHATVIQLDNGAPHSRITVTGFKIKKDGTSSVVPARTDFGKQPQWALDLVRRERERLNLTDEALTREG